MTLLQTDTSLIDRFSTGHFSTTDIMVIGLRNEVIARLYSYVGFITHRIKPVNIIYNIFTTFNYFFISVGAWKAFSNRCFIHILPRTNAFFTLSNFTRYRTIAVSQKIKLLFRLKESGNRFQCAISRPKAPNDISIIEKSKCSF